MEYFIIKKNIKPSNLLDLYFHSHSCPIIHYTLFDKTNKICNLCKKTINEGERYIDLMLNNTTIFHINCYVSIPIQFDKSYNIFDNSLLPYELLTLLSKKKKINPLKILYKNDHIHEISCYSCGSEIYPHPYCHVSINPKLYNYVKHNSYLNHFIDTYINHEGFKNKYFHIICLFRHLNGYYFNVRKYNFFPKFDSNIKYEKFIKKNLKYMKDEIKDIFFPKKIEEIFCYYINKNNIMKYNIDDKMSKFTIFKIFSDKTLLCHNCNKKINDNIFIVGKFFTNHFSNHSVLFYHYNCQIKKIDMNNLNLNYISLLNKNEQKKIISDINENYKNISINIFNACYLKDIFNVFYSFKLTPNYDVKTKFLEDIFDMFKKNNKYIIEKEHNDKKLIIRGFINHYYGYIYPEIISIIATYINNIYFK